MGRKQGRASRVADRGFARHATRDPRSAMYNAPGFKFFPMDGKNDSISVEIFGQTYNVRGEGDPDYLTELARFVDSRMREVAAQVATVDTVKIAILAALNIADEFSRYRKQRLGAWIEKTEELSNRLNKVIS
jgi:cell division protein ZapA